MGREVKFKMRFQEEKESRKKGISGRRNSVCESLQVGESLARSRNKKEDWSDFRGSDMSRSGRGQQGLDP